MQKIKDFDNLEKDPSSGAIILTASSKKSDIQLDYLVKKFSALYKQNEEILALLKDIAAKLDISNEHK